MELISFLAVPFAAVVGSSPHRERQLPTFKPRWWFRRTRLDARPVAWSLRNRPNDWALRGEYTIQHLPTKHEFWIGNGFGFYTLYQANCSCTERSDRGRFQRFQQITFHRAYKAWRREHQPGVDAEQFAAHFVTMNADK